MTNPPIQIYNAESPGFKKRRPNILTTQYLIQSGALCLVQILFKYTTYLTSHGILPPLSQSNSTQHRNIDVLYLKATMKLWQQQCQNLTTRKKMAAILNEGEVHFLQRILQAVEIIAECCAEVWNQGIEDEIAETMTRYKAWEGAGDSSADGAPYQYIETIDQAFHKSHASRTKDGLNNGGVRKVAWGDGRSPQGTSPKKSGGTRWQEEVGLQLGLSTGMSSNGQQLRAQKKMRVELFKTGVSMCAGTLLLCGNTQIQESCLGILRCLSQPFHESEVSEMHKQSVDVRGLPKMQSKASIAETLAERDRILSLVLEEMSSGTASVVKEALKTGQGHQTKSRPTSATHPKIFIRPSSAKYPQSSKVQAKPLNRPSSAKSATNEYSTKQPDISSYTALELTPKEPVYWQCTMHMLEMCGHHVMHMLRSEDAAIAKAAMLLVYDVVTFGEIIAHMKLASLGIMSILMQIIPQHIDSQDLALIGLMALQQLIASEYRLKQLFLSEGGKEFLERTTKNSHGAIRAHTDQFLSLIQQSGASLY